jgi:hypothetical protein
MINPGDEIAERFQTCGLFIQATALEQRRIKAVSYS